MSFFQINHMVTFLVDDQIMRQTSQPSRNHRYAREVHQRLKIPPRGLIQKQAGNVCELIQTEQLTYGYSYTYLFVVSPVPALSKLFSSLSSPSQMVNLVPRDEVVVDFGFLVLNSNVNVYLKSKLSSEGFRFQK